MKSLAIALLFAAVGCAAGESPENGTSEDALINGAVVPNGAFGSVVRFDEECTATQIAPRLLLTASHCVRSPNGQVSPSYAAGRGVNVESRKPDGTLVMTKIVIVSAKVHPRITEVCATENGGAGCKGSSATALRDAPDLALVKLAADIPYAKVTPISTTTARVDESLIPAGFGCVERLGGAYDDKLRSGTTPVIDSSEVTHLGSGVNATEAKALAGVYVFTEGPMLHGNNGVAGLCPGDSGGPLFRQTSDGLGLVGVSSSYTFMPSKTDVPATNWFSRLDAFAKHDVLAWLDKEGATFAR